MKMSTMLIHVSFFFFFSVFLLPRVMDAFLIDGMEIIFRLAVAILNFGKEDLLSQDMEGMLKVFFFVLFILVDNRIKIFYFSCVILIWFSAVLSKRSAGPF